MPSKNNQKKIKNKKQNKKPELLSPSSPLATPRKQKNKDLQVLLNDLSPFRPHYGTSFKSNLFVSNPRDLVMIETPVGKNQRPQIIEQMEIDLPKIEGLIIFENNESSNGPSSSQSSSEASKDSDSFESEEDILIEESKNQSNIEERKDMEEVKEEPVFKVDMGENLKKATATPKSAKKEKERKIFCNCKKTKCLKLYCDCFRENLTCDGCNCVGCHNLDDFVDERNNAMMSLMERNPDAFAPKINSNQHAKGCHCKKSNCLKKYCECYQVGLKCGQNCKCEDCKNCDTKEEISQEREEKLVTAKKEKKYTQWELEY